MSSSTPKIRRFVECAEKHAHLQPGQTIAEASSRNTGINLAMICASKGYPLVSVMSESFSVERRKVRDALYWCRGHFEKSSAQELADKHGWFFRNQFDNEANAWIREQTTTGPEIIDAFAADTKKLDHFVIAYGTGGSSLCMGRVLRRESRPSIKHTAGKD
jgi:cysteine synthase A